MHINTHTHARTHKHEHLAADHTGSRPVVSHRLLQFLLHGSIGSLYLFNFSGYPGQGWSLNGLLCLALTNQLQRKYGPLLSEEKDRKGGELQMFFCIHFHFQPFLLSHFLTSLFPLSFCVYMS